ncbi:unnamed protein product [Moneuplotes crassus]|uniref:Uncharacterized protein n=1 Tax=Euplotes crassus TaxID=5936 RepID=A0AAD1XAA7_EUPCR|nr:unnamed protein product [Moneuplotes crassus]
MNNWKECAGSDSNSDMSDHGEFDLELFANRDDVFCLDVSDETDIKDMGDVKGLKFEGRTLELLLIKATKGYEFADKHYLWKSSKATGNNIEKVAYHHYDFNISGKKQAKNFLSLLDTDYKNFKCGIHYTAVYLDFKLYLATCRNGGSSIADEVAQQIQDFINDVDEEGYIKPMIMLSKDFPKIMSKDKSMKLEESSNELYSEEEKKEIGMYQDSFQLKIQETPIEELATLRQVSTDETFYGITGKVGCNFFEKELPPKEPEKEIKNEKDLNKKRKKWQILKPYMHSEIKKEIIGFNIIQKYYGIDVSHFQKCIDWEKVRDCKLLDRELAFVFLQCTYATEGVDECYETNIQKVTETLDLKLKCPYHFLWVNENIEQQADLFDEMIQKCGNFDKKLDWIALDVEHPSPKYPEERKKSIETTDRKVWTNAVKEFMKRMGDKGYNKKIIYCNTGHWQTYLDEKESQELWKDCFLWITYLDQKPGYLERLWDYYNPSKYENSSFVQFCVGDLDGIKGKVDLNLVSDKFVKHW